MLQWYEVIVKSETKPQNQTYEIKKTQLDTILFLLDREFIFICL